MLVRTWFLLLVNWEATGRFKQNGMTEGFLRSFLAAVLRIDSRMAVVNGREERVRRRRLQKSGEE